MKNVLMASAAIALLISAASIAYYFVVFLPQQQSQTQKDISAIRAAVAPTPQEASQQVFLQKDEATRLDAYYKCTLEMTSKGTDYIKSQCPNSTFDLRDYWNCSAKVEQSDYYKQHFICTF